MRQEEREGEKDNKHKRTSVQSTDIPEKHNLNELYLTSRPSSQFHQSCHSTLIFQSSSSTVFLSPIVPKVIYTLGCYNGGNVGKKSKVKERKKNERTPRRQLITYLFLGFSSSLFLLDLCRGDSIYGPRGMTPSLFACRRRYAKGPLCLLSVFDLTS